jgi:hypothetical protein
MSLRMAPGLHRNISGTRLMATFVRHFERSLLTSSSGEFPVFSPHHVS